MAVELGSALKQRGLKLATAESCTGGWAAQLMTAPPGSSAWFECGFVTYSNIAKQDMLGVARETLATFGAVSRETACAMAMGALSHSQAHISLAITGIAGPAGAAPDKPIGTVWLAWAGLNRPVQSRLQHFTGGRETIRRQSVIAGLRGVLDFLDS